MKDWRWPPPDNKLAGIADHKGKLHFRVPKGPGRWDILTFIKSRFSTLNYNDKSKCLTIQDTHENRIAIHYINDPTLYPDEPEGGAA